VTRSSRNFDILDNYVARRYGREDVAAAEPVAAITV
jgi:hypothetical protein